MDPFRIDGSSLRQDLHQNLVDELDNEETLENAAAKSSIVRAGEYLVASVKERLHRARPASAPEPVVVTTTYETARRR